jgi:hypothetical protein
VAAPVGGAEPSADPAAGETKPEPLRAEPVTILEPEFPVPVWQDRVDGAEPEAVPGSPTPAPDAGTEETVWPVESDTAIAAGDAAVAFDDDEADEEALSDGPVPGSAADEEAAFPTAEELAASITENHAALEAFYASAGPETDYTEPAPAPEPPPAPPEAEPDNGARVSPAPEGLPPLEQVVGLSSMENAGKDVLLEVNAELHIYGRAKPDTELTLYGQIVRTRPDGTFSVRRILPHGAVVLPLLYKKP